MMNNNKPTMAVTGRIVGNRPNVHAHSAAGPQFGGQVGFPAVQGIPPDTNRRNATAHVNLVNNQPVRMFNNQPTQVFNNQPTQMFNNRFLQMFNNQPPQMFNNQVPQMFNDQPPQMFNNQPLRVFNNQSPQIFNNQPPLMFNSQPPQMFNTQHIHIQPPHERNEFFEMRRVPTPILRGEYDFYEPEGNGVYMHEEVVHEEGAPEEAIREEVVEAEQEEGEETADDEEVNVVVEEDRAGGVEVAIAGVRVHRDERTPSIQQQQYIWQPVPQQQPTFYAQPLMGQPRHASAALDHPFQLNYRGDFLNERQLYAPQPTRWESSIATSSPSFAASSPGFAGVMSSIAGVLPSIAGAIPSIVGAAVGAVASGLAAYEQNGRGLAPQRSNNGMLMQFNIRQTTQEPIITPATPYFNMAAPHLATMQPNRSYYTAAWVEEQNRLNNGPESQRPPYFSYF